MKIEEVDANNRSKAFEVHTEEGQYVFPYAKLSRPPSSGDPVVEVFPDAEAGGEAFTYRLRSGVEDTVHLDAVLEYNEDAYYLHDLLLHNLTVEAQKAFDESGMSKREVIRRLGTSASQLYRLLDPTYYGKSVGQMVALLRLLDREVDVVVRPKTNRERREHFAS